ncbi:hypothetical protein EON83_12745 [bacterium]|nr:MAG: hypothetical protein EON83_12745 [bacterium]
MGTERESGVCSGREGLETPVAHARLLKQDKVQSYITATEAVGYPLVVDASHGFGRLLERAQTQASMSRRAQCLDNAVAESFFSTLKAELLGDQVGRCFDSKAIAHELIADYIDHFYNTVRRYSRVPCGWGNKSPLAFELAHHINEQKFLSHCPL